MRHPRLQHGPPMRHTPTIMVVGLLAASPAHASLFSGDTLDLVANILAWVVLFIAPAIAIAVFWIVHILPEKIAEKRGHPQASAIKTLCLLSLFFGGMLWPLAWLWAYSRPVLYKLAYGTDVVPHGEGDHAAGPLDMPVEDVETTPAAVEATTPVEDRERPRAPHVRHREEV